MNRFIVQVLEVWTPSTWLKWDTTNCDECGVDIDEHGVTLPYVKVGPEETHYVNMSFSYTRRV